MVKKIQIGVIGLGNIGSSVAEVLRKNRNTILEGSGVDLKIKKVCDSRRIKTSLPFTTDANAVINDPDISVVVETIGGTKPALKFILAALNKGKHVVTPNKEVIAKHMPEILAAARKNRVKVMFEGAVGGGIPIIQPLKESLSANQISEVYGIVNGTTNYILSKMDEEGMEFSEALKKAQEKGYAEPDPTADIQGYDALYKTVILASLAFGVKVSCKDVYCEGITKISQEDLQYAKDIGYSVKLLSISRIVDGRIELRVHPALISKDHPLSAVSENFNAICVKGKPIGQVMFYGPGAGGGPTASAIISDIIHIAKRPKTQDRRLKAAKIRKIGDIASRYYIRMQVADKFGVLAIISRIFARKKVSIDAVIQKETTGNVATLVVLAHKVAEKNIKAALKLIEKLSVVKKVCNVIRIVS
ncbi:MAG: homoserine dehydrogenase [Candidatus Margulisiibacteriota bacterium]|nr:homoserine dehydrogenase [Candidatus Margulisiibacteriota bacterium]